MVVGFSSAALTSFAAPIILHLIASSRLTWRGLELLEPVIFLMPFSIIAGGAFQLAVAWHVREGDLRPVATARIFKSAFNVTGSLAGGFFYSSPITLIVSVILSTFLGLSLLARRASKLFLNFRLIRFKRFAGTARTHSKEAVISTFVSFLNVANTALLPLLFAQYYSSAEVAWFALAERLGAAPMAIVAGALGQSFWAEAAKLVRSNYHTLLNLYLATTRRLSFFALPLICTYLAAPWFTGPIFGRENWANAGYVLAALTPMLIGQLIAGSLSHLTVHRRQSWQLIWEVTRLIGTLTVIYVCGRLSPSFTTTVLAISLYMLFMYVILFFLNYIRIRQGQLRVFAK